MHFELTSRHSNAVAKVSERRFHCSLCIVVQGLSEVAKEGGSGRAALPTVPRSTKGGNRS